MVLPKQNLLAESNCWEYVQTISTISFQLNYGEHAFPIIFGEHAPHAVIVCQDYLFGLQITGTCILKVLHPHWSPTLNPWLISFSWSFISFSMISSQTLNKLLFPLLKCTWALNKWGSTVSDLHRKKLNSEWKKTHSNISSNTWSANYT